MRGKCPPRCQCPVKLRHILAMNRFARTQSHKNNIIKNCLCDELFHLLGEHLLLMSCLPLYLLYQTPILKGKEDKVLYLIKIVSKY